MKNKPLYLASASPRRAQLLRQMDLTFSVIPVPGEESIDLSLNESELAKSIALEKMNNCLHFYKNKPESQGTIISADTLGFADKTLLIKPKNRDEAKVMLEALSGKEHTITTGLALYEGKTGRTVCQSSTTKVQFAPLSPLEIEDYLRTEEWQDAAGAYKIQGQAAKFIKSINGCYYNVMGLPINLLYGMLSLLNYQQ